MDFWYSGNPVYRKLGTSHMQLESGTWDIAMKNIFQQGTYCNKTVDEIIYF
jgi:hypothetical protein